MYEIDMLKKHGIPHKSTPLLTILATMAIAIPVFFCLLLAIEYMSNQIQISFSSSMLTKIQDKVKFVPYDQRLNTRMEQEFGLGLSSVDEIINGVERNIQWTPVFAEIVSFLPENLAIADFDLRRSTEKMRIEDPKKEKARKEVEIITRTLKMTVFNLKSGKNNDDAQEYINRLNNSEVLKKDMEIAKIAMIKVEDFEGQPMPCYMIECVFKSGYKGEIKGRSR